MGSHGELNCQFRTQNEEKKMLLEFLLAVVSCRDKTQCVGNVHKISGMCVAEFNFLTKNLDNGC